MGAIRRLERSLCAGSRGLVHSAQSVLTEIIDFVNGNTKGRVIYLGAAAKGVVATSEEEMDRITEFVEQVRTRQPEFNYQRNTIYLRFCHADFHKGAALAELSRLINIPREEIFAAGDHHNDVSMLDGRFAAMPACPANAIAQVKDAVRSAHGYIAEREFGGRRPRSSAAFPKWKSVEGLKGLKRKGGPVSSSLPRFNSLTLQPPPKLAAPRRRRILPANRLVM